MNNLKLIGIGLLYVFAIVVLIPQLIQELLFETSWRRD